MPSFQDSAFIFFLALLLFGPKKLPELARQLGKLMGEFRRASNEFRMQMEDELRASEQADRQKEIAAIEAAAPAPAPLLSEGEPYTHPDKDWVEEHPHLPSPVEENLATPIEEAAPSRDPLPIATSGDLTLMPPATGLPVGRSETSSSISAAFDSIPHGEQDDLPTLPAGATGSREAIGSEATQHG